MTNNEKKHAEQILNTAKSMLPHIPNNCQPLKDKINNLTIDSHNFDDLILSVSYNCSIYNKNDKNETAHELLHYLADIKKNGDACYSLACNYKCLEQNADYNKYMSLAKKYGSKLLETTPYNTLASSSTTTIQAEESNSQPHDPKGKKPLKRSDSIIANVYRMFFHKHTALDIKSHSPQKWQEENLSKEEYNSMNNSL